MHDAKAADYGAIFDDRGALYDRAMTLYPRARAREFAALLELAGILDGEAVCDFPAGGGYSADYINPRADLTLLETSTVFADLCAQRGHEPTLTSGNVIPFPGGAFDKILSLAALHHNEDQLGFLRECARALKPGGALCLADVEMGSPQDSFLNGFIDRHVPQGHKGYFIGPHMAQQMTKVGLTPIFVGRKSCPWVFESIPDLLRFCGLLFGVDRLDPILLLQGIEANMEIHEKNDQILLNWSLCFIKAVTVADQ